MGRGSDADVDVHGGGGADRLVLGLVTSACAGVGAAEGARPTIGFLRLVPSEAQDVFADELKAQGWGEGASVRVLPDDSDDLQLTVDDALSTLRGWERQGLDLVIAFSTPYAQLVADETDLPGLFVVNDPVGSGLTADLHAPTGRLTGIAWRAPADRTIDLADRMLGGMSRIGYLQPSDDSAVTGHREMVRDVAGSMGIEVVVSSFSSPTDVARAVEELAHAEVDVVYVSNANQVATAVDELESAFDRHRLAAISNVAYVDFGILTLAPDIDEAYRQLARQAARILEGARVGSVPVEDPQRFVVTIDRRRAEALGHSLPPEILREADLVR